MESSQRIGRFIIGRVRRLEFNENEKNLDMFLVSWLYLRSIPFYRLFIGRGEEFQPLWTAFSPGGSTSRITNWYSARYFLPLCINRVNLLRRTISFWTLKSVDRFSIFHKIFEYLLFLILQISSQMPRSERYVCTHVHTRKWEIGIPFLSNECATPILLETGLHT